MSKPLLLFQAPVTTRSGYGNHSRDLVLSLIKSDKYDVKIMPINWGDTPMNALETGNKNHDLIAERLLTAVSKVRINGIGYYGRISWSWIFT